MLDNRVSQRGVPVVIQHDEPEPQDRCCPGVERRHLAAFAGVLVLIGYLEWRTRRDRRRGSAIVNDLGMRIIGTVPAFPNKANLNAAVEARAGTRTGGSC